MLTNKKIYIAGCGGMLGEALYKNFRDDYQLKCADIDVNEPWLSRLDFRNANYYRQDVANFGPDYLFHIGAHTNLEYCETNPDDAYNTNTFAVANAVIIANQLNIPILYISTAGIFDGDKDIYDEWDQPNPINHYARSKYLGELFVKQYARRYLICRPGWMMGGGPKKDKKLINKLIEQIKSGKKEIFIVNDQSGTPTYTHDLAKNIKTLLQKELWGLYNTVCSGEPGRVAIVQELVKIFDLEKEIRITPVNSSFFKDTYFAPRPRSEHLINKKLSRLGLNMIRDWKIALKEYINGYY